MYFSSRPTHFIANFFVFLFFIFVLASCQEDKTSPEVASSDSSGIHVKDLKGVMHGEENNSPESSCSSSSCHGADLQGAGGPSCTKCHAALWNGETGPPSSHTISKKTKLHHPDLATPIGACDSCHGTDLKGDSGPSCYTCHSAVWDGIFALPESHSITFGGKAHHTKLFSATTDCVDCHGADLTGGNIAAVSCTSCHVQNWVLVSGVPASHNQAISKNGVTGMHHPDHASATTVCSLCHGVDLTGGAVATTSCYKCHGVKW